MGARGVPRLAREALKFLHVLQPRPPARVAGRSKTLASVLWQKQNHIRDSRPPRPSGRGSGLQARALRRRFRGVLCEHPEVQFRKSGFEKAGSS